MEYKIFKFMRNGSQIPLFIRFFVGSLLIFFSSLPIILPIFPGSLIIGVVMLAVGLLLIVPGKKVRHVIKLRKGIIYLMTNFHKKNVIDQKMKDIRYHIKDILRDHKYVRKQVKNILENHKPTKIKK